jgi:flagellar motility protein MotE (MotC chaperone)
MKVNLFGSILALLIITLFVKASMLFGRIQEQTIYGVDTNTSSVLVDTAYAKKNQSPENAKPPQRENYSDEIYRAKIVNTPPSSENTNINSVNNLSRSEINLLKDLSKRRESIEKEKKELDVREQVIKETESKLDQKVIQLQKLQAQVEDLMKQYDKKEHNKILSLVKIYENMRPKDAANIFNELEMRVLLKVISNMKEVKVAPIIASMNPVKAREVSMELAKQKSY